LAEVRPCCSKAGVERELLDVFKSEPLDSVGLEVDRTAKSFVNLDHDSRVSPIDSWLENVLAE
jgi:hypothetical protein